MDRRAKKLEKKRRNREQAKKKARALAARKPDELTRLMRSAARAEFGPCFVSAGWADLRTPALVTVVVTRTLGGGLYVPGVALVDRTCLGIKDGFAQEALTSSELDRFVEHAGRAHGEMHPCRPELAQSVVFHAIDYAKRLGFEPHPDFPAALFGPRPAELAPTPWHAPEQPIYISGPHDNVPAILAQLNAAVGPGNFSIVQGMGFSDFDYDDDELAGEDDDADPVFEAEPIRRLVDATPEPSQNT